MPMLTILPCLPADHDLRYVAAALLVCGLGSILSMRLLARVRRNTGLRRFHLLFLAGLVAGGLPSPRSASPSCFPCSASSSPRAPSAGR